MPNEPQIILELIRLTNAGDVEAADQLRRILVADITAAAPKRVAELAGYLFTIKTAEARAGAK